MFSENLLLNVQLLCFLLAQSNYSTKLFQIFYCSIFGEKEVNKKRIIPVEKKYRKSRARDNVPAECMAFLLEVCALCSASDDTAVTTVSTEVL